MLYTNTITPASSASSAIARRTALRIAAVGAFAGLAAVAAMVRIPMPGTPVPATLQTLVVVLAGVLMGGRLATVSMAAYLALGSAGFLLFATTGGSTLGYLVGFVLAQPLIAFFARPRTSQAAQIAGLGAAALAGHAVIFACGLAWLWVWSGQPLAAVIAMGFLPFAGVDLALKSAAAVAIGSLAMGRARRMLEIS